MPLTLSSSCVYCSSIELPHAIGVFKHKFLKKSLSVLWYELVVWVYSDLDPTSVLCSTTRKRNILNNYLTVFQLSWDGRAGNKRSSGFFWKSVEFPPCHDDLELDKLFRTIGYINAHVKKSILSFLADRIRLLIFIKLQKM